MSDNYPEALKTTLQAAILAALASEGIDLEGGATAVVTNAVLGEAEIVLTS